MNAVSAADMALAGVVGHIPADEVIDAMAEVGNAMSKDLRETGIGGLAGTPTGRAICEIVTMNSGEDSGEAARRGEGTPPYAKRHHKPQGGMAPCRRGVEDAAPYNHPTLFIRRTAF